MKTKWLLVVALVVVALPTACQNMEQVLQRLRSDNEGERRQAVEQLAQFGTQPVAALLNLLDTPDLSPGAQAAARVALEQAVLRAARPGANAERMAVEKTLIAHFQKSQSETTKQLILRLMEVVGSAQSVPMLQKLLEDRAWREMARATLQQIPGLEATLALERAFTRSKEIPWKAALLEAIGTRAQPRSAPLVAQSLRSPNPQLRAVAIAVSAGFDEPAIQKSLQQLAQRGSQREREQAQHTLLRLAERLQRQGKAATATALFQWLYTNGADPLVRSGALTGLARSRTAQSAALLVQALEHPNPQIATTAATLLREARGRDIAQNLLKQLSVGRGEKQIRLIELLGYQRDSAALVVPALVKLFDQSEPDVQVAIIDALARLAHPEAASVLATALRSTDGRLQQAAIQAVPGVALALHRRGQTNAATQLAREALAPSRQRETMLLLVGTLRRMGEAISPGEVARRTGMIVKWWVLAPAGERSQLRAQDILDPNAPPNLQQPLAGASWRRVEIEDPLGVLDFWQISGGRENTGGYAYAEIYSDAERPAMLLIGSDDDVVCWLNGRKVHEFIGDRGLGIDQDRVNVTLQAGWNRLLCKVLNGANGWQLTVRVVDREGRPIVLEQR